jgi:hypothetical protein
MHQSEVDEALTREERNGIGILTSTPTKFLTSVLLCKSPSPHVWHSCEPAHSAECDPLYRSCLIPSPKRIYSVASDRSSATSFRNPIPKPNLQAFKAHSSNNHKAPSNTSARATSSTQSIGYAKTPQTWQINDPFASSISAPNYASWSTTASQRGVFVKDAANSLLPYRSYQAFLS